MSDTPDAVHGTTADVQFKTPPTEPAFNPLANAHAVEAIKNIVRWAFDVSARAQVPSHVTPEDPPASRPTARGLSHTWTADSPAAADSTGTADETESSEETAARHLTADSGTVLESVLGRFDHHWQVSVQVDPETGAYVVGAQHPVGDGLAYRLALHLEDAQITAIDTQVPALQTETESPAHAEAARLRPPHTTETRNRLLDRIDRFRQLGYVRGTDTADDVLDIELSGRGMVISQAIVSEPHRELTLGVDEMATGRDVSAADVQASLEAVLEANEGQTWVGVRAKDRAFTPVEDEGGPEPDYRVS